jgi:hypothetical protein
MREKIYKRIPEWKTEQICGEIKKLKQFVSSKQFVSTDGNSGIAIDSRKGKIALFKFPSNEIKCELISASDLLSIEIVIDGRSVQKSVPSTKIGSAIIGGLLLGGVGAVVGAIAGNSQQTTTSNLTGVLLRLVINHDDDPLHELTFLTTEAGSYSERVVTAKREAQEVYALLSVLKHNSENQLNSGVKENKRAISKVNKQPKVAQSPADEIIKLAELLKSGAITEAEFATMKAATISKSIAT